MKNLCLTHTSSRAASLYLEIFTFAETFWSCWRGIGAIASAYS